MTVLVASDLDRTLIYSRAAAETDASDLMCVELYDGEPLSYLTPRAADGLRRLAERTELVPVTTRTREQYQRITLPVPPRKYAICANGGHLLVDGVPDVRWHLAVRRRLASVSAELAEVSEWLAKTADPQWTLKHREAEDLFCYLVVDRAAMPLSYVDEMIGWCEPRGWEVSVQGRKVYAVPRELTKSGAVAEVAGRIDADTVLAAGDSLLDAELLAAADAAVRPGHGELADSNWTAPRVTALSARGAAGGEAIIDWLLAAAEHRVGGGTLG
ncbi:HAD family hydrolase [Fodinicola acaciae]|uniref:HAD family hydrolase n=1 Tax=Fodinicola acaciae TaxID=2681555 RepID=UPI0013D2E0D5|nr:HAD family hydrolase [Fodinicola acaciae]